MLLKEPEARTDPAPDPGPETRACEACGAAMSPEQDWCLTCGTAAPGRLGTRPGRRAAGTIVAITLLLTGGAVAAGYAALSGDAEQRAASPAGPDGTPVAQAPPQSQPPAAVTPPPGAATPPATTTPPATSAPPAVTGPTPAIPSGRATPTPSPIAPSPGTQTPTPSPSPSTPSNDAPSPRDTGSDDDAPSSRPDNSSGSGKPELSEINLGADAARLYDPYENATAKGDPADAYDEQPNTSWSVTVADGSERMGVGLVLDLEQQRAIKVLELATSTPGFRVEIYATDSDELPPDVLDTRWAHIRDRSRVDQQSTRDSNKAGDGKERIVLGGGSRRYRHVLLWLTTPPDDGATVKISELKLFS